MEPTSRYGDLSDTEEDTSLENFTAFRLHSASTDTEDTHDGSDEERGITGLDTDKTKNVSSETLHKDEDGYAGHPRSDAKDSPWQAPSGNKSSLGSNPSEAKTSPVLPNTGAHITPRTTDYSPEEENELFSSDYVDKLVASFWTKVDQKIETAISQHQPSPQAGQQTNNQDNAQTAAGNKKDDDKCSLSKSPLGVCVFIFFILQFIGRIFALCSDKIKSKGKDWFSDGKWRVNIAALTSHRHANFAVVMVAVFDCFLVVANILADFDVIDDKGIEFIFVGFLYLNLVIMILFITECFVRVAVLRRDLFKDKMEIFDLALISSYFLAEAISSHGFSDVEDPYPKYLHIIVILRLWRILLVAEQLQQEREELSSMESQTSKQ